MMLACEGEPEPNSPEGTVWAFVRAMEGSGAAEGTDAARLELKRAYELLSNDAQATLERRAERATALAGREFKAWQMLVGGGFELKVKSTPDRPMRVDIDGQRATVEVCGERNTARVPLVMQRGRWRLDLKIPQPK